jgi:hypothetical protein
VSIVLAFSLCLSFCSETRRLTEVHKLVSGWIGDVCLWVLRWVVGSGGSWKIFEISWVKSRYSVVRFDVFCHRTERKTNQFVSYILKTSLFLLLFGSVSKFCSSTGSTTCLRTRQQTEKLSNEYIHYHISVVTLKNLTTSARLATDLEARVRFPALPDFLRNSGSATGFT